MNKLFIKRKGLRRFNIEVTNNFNYDFSLLFSGKLITLNQKSRTIGIIEGNNDYIIRFNNEVFHVKWEYGNVGRIWNKKNSYEIKGVGKGVKFFSLEYNILRNNEFIACVKCKTNFFPSKYRLETHFAKNEDKDIVILLSGLICKEIVSQPPHAA